MSVFNRRKFLKIGSLTTVTSFLTFKTGFSSNKNNCSLTTSDILGPYYIANPPSRTRITDASEPGEKLVISGTVYDINCKPLSGVTVDVWQANAAGEYDLTNAYKLRGKMLTDEDGNYEFETVVPGAYDSGGGNYRPKHIHYKLYGQNIPELITQLYFKGDPYIPSDPWASTASAEKRINAIEKDVNNVLRGTFDIYLDTVTGIFKPDPSDSTGYLIQNYPNPFTENTNLRYGVFTQSRVMIQVTDLSGNMVKILTDEEMIAGRYLINWDGKDESGNRRKGIYICKMFVNNLPFKEVKMIVS